MTDFEQLRPLELLLVDDDPGDARLTAEAFKRSRLRTHLSVVTDGFEALDFLHRRGGFASAPVPDLILLDLNMPRKDGREVLAEIKDDAALAHIPVVVLTTSARHEDVLRSYQLHANCYVTKPVDLGTFLDIVETIDYFWFTVAKLPGRS